MLAALLLAALGAQEVEPIRDRLLARLRGQYGDLSEVERAALADRLAADILAVRRHGYDASAVLDRVDWMLADGSVVSQAVRSSAERMSEGMERWIPDIRERLALPRELAALEAKRTIEVARLYLTETLARPPAGEDERRRIREQFERVREEIRTAARTKIYGAYGGAVVDRWLEILTKDQITENLGHPLDGSLSRALTAEELDGVIRTVREEIGRMEPVEASADADADFARTGKLDLGAKSKAIAAASVAAHRLFLLADLNYPKSAKANEELRATQMEIAGWIEKTWPPLAAELAGKGAQVTQAPPSREALLPLSPRPSGSPERGDVPGASPRPPAPRPAARTWILAGVLLAVIATAWALRRRRT